MKFTRLSIYALACVTSFALWSCGGSKEENKNSEDFSKAEESLKEQVQEVVKNLPSPSEIPYVIQNTGAEFNPSLLNDKKKGTYFETGIAALKITAAHEFHHAIQFMYGEDSQTPALNEMTSTFMEYRLFPETVD